VIMMFRSALKAFKKNIWDVFAITGFVAVGILIGVLVAFPVINNEINVSVNKIISKATAIPYSGFDISKFLTSVTDQLKNLDFRNPVRTIVELVERNGFFRIFMNALTDANFNKDVLIEMKDVVEQCSDSLIHIVKREGIFVITCTLISSVIALVASRVIIQIRCTSNKSIGRFFASFFLNLGTVLAAYYLIALSLLNLSGAWLVIVIVLIFMVMLALVLLWACVSYKEKFIKFKEIFNYKNVLFLWLSSLAVISVSALIFFLIFLFNDVIAFVILLPLIIISNIICENIVIEYVNEFSAEKKMAVNNETQEEGKQNA
ncbi:MAG: hypothetical protein MJ239_06060, partial [Bacilli bacterium]|nr:hypothetical protein [Bacilli bacterium]